MQVRAQEEFGEAPKPRPLGRSSPRRRAPAAAPRERRNDDPERPPPNLGEGGGRGTDRLVGSLASGPGSAARIFFWPPRPARSAPTGSRASRGTRRRGHRVHGCASKPCLSAFFAVAEQGVFSRLACCSCAGDWHRDWGSGGRGEKEVLSNGVAKVLHENFRTGGCQFWALTFPQSTQ